MSGLKEPSYEMFIILLPIFLFCKNSKANAFHFFPYSKNSPITACRQQESVISFYWMFGRLRDIIACKKLCYDHIQTVSENFQWRFFIHCNGIFILLYKKGLCLCLRSNCRLPSFPKRTSSGNKPTKVKDRDACAVRKIMDN